MMRIVSDDVTVMTMRRYGKVFSGKVMKTGEVVAVKVVLIGLNQMCFHHDGLTL